MASDFLKDVPRLIYWGEGGYRILITVLCSVNIIFFWTQKDYLKKYFPVQKRIEDSLHCNQVIHMEYRKAKTKLNIWNLSNAIMYLKKTKPLGLLFLLGLLIYYEITSEVAWIGECLPLYSKLHNLRASFNFVSSFCFVLKMAPSISLCIHNNQLSRFLEKLNQRIMVAIYSKEPSFPKAIRAEYIEVLRYHRSFIKFIESPLLVLHTSFLYTMINNVSYSLENPNFLPEAMTLWFFIIIAEIHSADGITDMVRNMFIITHEIYYI